MRALLYCVWLARGLKRPAVVGVGARPVAVIGEAGLEAAVSRIEEPELIPDLQRVRAYEQVVEACFERQPVVPMRYGSSFEDEAQARQFLAQRAERFGAQLAELGASVEMGVRAVITSARPAAREGAPAASVERPRARSPARARASEPGPEDPAASRGEAVEAPGRAYLSSLRERFSSAGSAEQAELVERLRKVLGGQARRVKVEEAPALGLRLDGAAAGREGEQRSSVALYFLVPRERVEAFREQYERAAGGEAAELQLSGPWPPYNFVG